MEDKELGAQVVAPSNDSGNSKNWLALLGGVVLLLFAGIFLVISFFAVILSSDGGFGKSLSTLIFFLIIMILLSIGGIRLIFKGLNIKKMFVAPDQTQPSKHSGILVVFYSFILAVIGSWLISLFVNIFIQDNTSLLIAFGKLLSFPILWIVFYFIFSKSHTTREKVFRLLIVFIAILLLNLPPILFAIFTKAPPK